MIFDEQKLNSLSAAYTNWEQTTLKKTLDRMPERRETFVTQSSVPIKRLYTPLDIPDLRLPARPGLTRRIPLHARRPCHRHRGKLWTMRMFAGFGTAEETNARYKYLLDQGNMGLIRRLRSGHPDGLRHRRARSLRRVRQMRRGDQFAQGYGNPV